MTATVMKRCAECGSEFQSWVERCIDCGGALELSDGSSPPLATRAAAAPSDEMPPDADDVCVRVVPLPWARGLSAALDAEGIAHRIDEAPPKPGEKRAQAGMVGIWVRPDDERHARAVDADYERNEIPDLPAEQGSEEHCPACGEPCQPDAGECASCGLEFPSAE